METVHWKVEGMSCSNCVLTINHFLEKKGMQNIRLSLAGGDLSFDINGQHSRNEIKNGIEGLGYQVVEDSQTAPPHIKSGNKYLRYLLICLPFTAILMLHMLDHWIHLHWLMNPWVQLGLCLPVYITGMQFFGRSAIASIRNRIPNMNVLISIGSTAAFVYSLTGTLLNLGPDYLFYETTAAIISFVFLGNYLEDVSLRSTQRSLSKLVRSQKVMAHMLTYDEHHHEHIFPVENTQLRSGDLILIKSGEQVPADCKILWGNVSVNESLITGESLPVEKTSKDHLLGGSTLADGTVKAQVTAAAGDSVLARIIQMVKQAQGEKPPLQQLADRISAIFVPVVLGIALLTFIINYLVLHDLTSSIMRSVAVLVIACPCAMGLATPAAIAVGLGRAANNGILFRHARSLEIFRNIRQVVFDKTGTLTTGENRIKEWGMVKEPRAESEGRKTEVGEREIDEDEFKRIVYSIEKYSNHPLAKGIVKSWKVAHPIKWKKLDEIKGLGIRAEASNGDIYEAGSWKGVKNIDRENLHQIYISINKKCIGWIDMDEEIRPEAAAVIQYFKSKKIKTILLSGDRAKNCREIAARLQMDESIAEQSPEEKMACIIRLSQEFPIAMVGDGINDAPALAKASLGISMSEASQIAMQTADLVLMGQGLRNLPISMELGRHTYSTIRQNLFWAFFYNIIAIPLAGFGLLTPAIAALSMGFSDVLLVGNSMRLYFRKIDQSV